MTASAFRVFYPPLPSDSSNLTNTTTSSSLDTSSTDANQSDSSQFGGRSALPPPSMIGQQQAFFPLGAGDPDFRFSWVQSEPSKPPPVPGGLVTTQPDRKKPNKNVDTDEVFQILDHYDTPRGKKRSLENSPSSTTASRKKTKHTNTHERPADHLIYRDSFHNFPVTLPTDLAQKYDDCAVYIDPSIAYAGNAKLFKKMPDADEHALLLNVKVYLVAEEGVEKEVKQCGACHEYFQMKKYFKASPEAASFITLVKSNQRLRVRNAKFKFALRSMCCSDHYDNEDFLYRFTLTDNKTGIVIMRATKRLLVKQWKKSSNKRFDQPLVFQPTHSM